MTKSWTISAGFLNDGHTAHESGGSQNHLRNFNHPGEHIVNFRGATFPFLGWNKIDQSLGVG